MFTSIVIFEDNEVLRQSLTTLLSTENNFAVVGNYSNVLNAKAAIEQNMPDVVIMDIDMPKKSGIDAVAEIKEIHPEVAIIMYTQFEDEDKLFKSLCAGANGYMLKKTSPLKLFDAINEVRNGGAPMSPSIASKVLLSFREKAKPIGQRFDLTKREEELLGLLVKGYSVKQIASELFIAFDTVRTHLKNIYRKLHVNCGREAIAKILANKIIE